MKIDKEEMMSQMEKRKGKEPNPKGLGILIGVSKGKGDKSEAQAQDDENEDDAALDEAAADIIGAIKMNKPEDLRSALEDFIKLCSAEEEGY